MKVRTTADNRDEAHLAFGCQRCGVHHKTKLCADPAPRFSRDWYALRALQLDPRGAFEQSLGAVRQRALRWVAGMVTASGRDRGIAVATCGRPVAVLVGDRLAIGGMRCRDRACPRCEALRSTELAAKLAAYIEHREDDGPMWFVTLTQVKPHGSDPRAAIDTMMHKWRWWTNTRTAQGRAWRGVFTGALRVMEVTWSPKGKRRKDGSRVPYDGWHAHFHAVLQGGTEAEVHEQVKRWCAQTGACFQAQDVQTMTADHCREICKYVVKPMMDVPVHLGRRLFETVHGRRLCEGIGDWRGWQRVADEISPDDENPPVQWAVHGEPDEQGMRKPMPLALLMESYGDLVRRREEGITFHGWGRDGELVTELPVEQVGERLLDKPRWLHELMVELREATATATEVKQSPSLVSFADERKTTHEHGAASAALGP